MEIDPKLNSKKFWTAKYKEQKVPSNVTTNTKSKTATSSLSKDGGSTPQSTEMPQRRTQQVEIVI